MPTLSFVPGRQFLINTNDQEFLQQPGMASPPPPYDSTAMRQDVILPFDTTFSPDELRSNHPGVMAHIPPFLLKGTMGAVIGMGIYHFTEAGIGPKVMASLLIGLSIKVFPELIAISRESRDAKNNADHIVLTDAAYNKLIAEFNKAIEQARTNNVTASE